jgi:hypothetical protein
VDAELAEDATYAIFHCLHLDGELHSNFLVRRPARHSRDHLDLACGQTAYGGSPRREISRAESHEPVEKRRECTRRRTTTVVQDLVQGSAQVIERLLASHQPRRPSGHAPQNRVLLVGDADDHRADSRPPPGETPDLLARGDRINLYQYSERGTLHVSTHRFAVTVAQQHRSGALQAECKDQRL